MSQTVVYVEDVNNGIEYISAVYTFWRYVDSDDIELIAINEELYGEIEAQYYWYEIGEGESGTDEFFTLTELYDMYAGKGLETELRERGYDYDVELIDYGKIVVYVEQEE